MGLAVLDEFAFVTTSLGVLVYPKRPHVKATSAVTRSWRDWLLLDWGIMQEIRRTVLFFYVRNVHTTGLTDTAYGVGRTIRCGRCNPNANRASNAFVTRVPRRWITISSCENLCAEEVRKPTSATPPNDPDFFR